MPYDISPATHLIIKGARVHNLKNVDLVLPKNKLIVFTGLSGSGKSSLAFDTIYAEGQRRYVESLSSYARQFLGIMQKPDVDRIDGLSPAISIDQKTTSHNPRSTVGTITEIYDYLRLLYARIGHPYCPDCHIEITPQSVDQIADKILRQIEASFASKTLSRWQILSPVVKNKRGEFTGLFKNLSQKGFERVRIDGRQYSLDDDFVLIKTNRHQIDVVIDRFTLSRSQLKSLDQKKQFLSRLSISLTTALDLSGGLVIASDCQDPGFDFPENPQVYSDHLFSQKLACPQCNRSFNDLEPRLFSFNTPEGACAKCAGLGSLLKMDVDKIIAPELTLTEGAFIPLASALSYDSWYARKLKVIFEAWHLSLNTIYADLPTEFKHFLLYGGSNWHHVSGSNRQGREASFSFQWEGIINELERRFRETNSDFIRTEFEKYMKKEICPECHGTRLKPEALSVIIDSLNIFDLVSLDIASSLKFIDTLYQEALNPDPQKLNPSEQAVAQPICKEIKSRLEFLVSVGLEYLTLHREAATLAGGEAQRIRLASQIGTGLTGVLYVLDEPTIGLHPRDTDRLINTLKQLRDLGNTVIVVEHDESVMKAADMIVDFGPQAGIAGGQILASKPYEDFIKESDSLTARYLKGSLKIDAKVLSQAQLKLPGVLTSKLDRLPPTSGSLQLQGAKIHNLHHLNVDFPLSKLIAVTGVSGSGKSSLIHDTLYPALRTSLGQKVSQPLQYDRLLGTDAVNRVDLIDQSPIGRTPRSNPATYTKAFDHIRTLFSLTKEARTRGFKPGRFSFNIKGGRCEACQGEGQVKIEMQFLSDVYVTCDVCHGTRYNRDTLSILYKQLNIAQILDLSVDQAIPLFTTFTPLLKKLATLQAVGLGYIKLGQPAPTLSGGEAQRVKLAKELSVLSSQHTVYLLDEPTTGLHFEDVKHLLVVLKQLVALDNTVVVIEHNPHVILNADWVIDLGPEGGNRGGNLVVAGTPATVASDPASYTGNYLKSFSAL